MKLPTLSFNVTKIPSTTAQALEPFYALRDRLMTVVVENNEYMEQQDAIAKAANENAKNAAFEAAEANIALNKLGKILK